jgi:hypothetical protein
MITYDSFNQVACATHQDVGETSKTVESGKKLVCGLRGTVSNEHENARSLTSTSMPGKATGLSMFELTECTHPKPITAFTAVGDALTR